MMARGEAWQSPRFSAACGASGHVIDRDTASFALDAQSGEAAACDQVVTVFPKVCESPIETTPPSWAHRGVLNYQAS